MRLPCNHCRGENPVMSCGADPGSGCCDFVGFGFFISSSSNINASQLRNHGGGRLCAMGRKRSERSAPRAAPYVPQTFSRLPRQILAASPAEAVSRNGTCPGVRGERLARRCLNPRTRADGDFEAIESRFRGPTPSWTDSLMDRQPSARPSPCKNRSRCRQP